MNTMASGLGSGHTAAPVGKPSWVCVDGNSEALQPYMLVRKQKVGSLSGVASWD